MGIELNCRLSQLAGYLASHLSELDTAWTELGNIIRRQSIASNNKWAECQIKLPFHLQC